MVSHPSAAKIVDAVLALSVAGVLKRHGFRRVKSKTFIRTMPDEHITQRISIQLVRARTEPEVNIYFGIGYESLRELEAKWKGVPIGAASESQLGDSIGHIVPPYHFRSIPVIDECQLQGAVLHELEDHVLPFLGRHSSLDEAVACWDGDYPYGRVNARIFGPLGHAALGDFHTGVRSAKRHLEVLRAAGADDDVLGEQARLARFIERLGLERGIDRAGP